MNNNRSLRNMLVLPRFQLKLCMFYAITGIIMLGGVSLLIYFRLSEVQMLLSESPRVDYLVEQQINEIVMSCIAYSLVAFMLYIVIAFVYALIMGHRIAGPQVAINAYIDQLGAGNFDYDRGLRPRDELKDVMTHLQRLKIALIARQHNSEME